MTDHQPQFRLLSGLAHPLPTLVLQFGQPLPRRQDPRLEFRLVEQPIAVGIDQPRDHLLEICDHLVEMLHLAVRPGLRPLQPPLVLRPDPLGLGQEMAHVFPDGGVQDIGADLLVPAQALAAEAIGVGARAAVVGVRDLPLGRGPARRLAVAAVAAPLADDQALEEIAVAMGPLATAAPVLLELGLDRPEELLAHQSGDLDEDLLLRGCVDPRDGPTRLLGPAALRAQPLRLEVAGACLAEGGRPLVGGVPEIRPDHRAVPGRFAGPRGDAVALQASADLTDRASLLAHPLEDLPHDPRLFGHDLIARLPAALVLTDVTVAVGRAGEDVDRAAARGVLLAPAATLQDLGALVLGDHALDLEEQVLLGAAADGVAHEDDLDAAPGEFLQDEHLIGILARESIRVEHVEAVDDPGGGLVPEPLQARAHQDTPAVAVVDEAQLGVAFQAVALDAPDHRLQLTVDRVLLGLLFPGDAGIERHAEVVVGHGWSSSPGLRSEIPGRRRDRPVAPPSRRRGQRPGDDRDQHLVCTRDQIILEAREREVAGDAGAEGPTAC